MGPPRSVLGESSLMTSCGRAPDLPRVADASAAWKPIVVSAAISRVSRRSRDAVRSTRTGYR
jgi:hypothetical protein